MTRKLTILIAPVGGVGHVNATIGIAETLYSRGHRIVFAIDQSFKGRLIKRGFEEEIVEKSMTEEEVIDPSGYFIKRLEEMGVLADYSPLDKLKFMVESMFKLLSKEEDQILNEIIKRTKPDVILIDFMFAPSIINSGIPWVSVVSAQILSVIDDPRTPPPWLGITANDNSEWQKYRDLSKVYTEKLKKNYYDLFENGSPFPEDRFIESPYLNVYSYPKELDYTDQRPLPPKWHQFDSFIRLKEEDFELPEKLAQKTGKLIFLSMGSLGSANVTLMKRLLEFIADLPFRFIVAKGIYGDQYNLPNNCWGDKMVPQIKVLPKVDLVITHGGNNTVTETFYFGKPMIIMPMFGDQFDNAQRVHEKGFGIRMNPHQCTKEELNNAINKLVYDDDLVLRMKKISQRIQLEIKQGKVGELIEKLVID